MNPGSPLHQKDVVHGEDDVEALIQQKHMPWLCHVCRMAKHGKTSDLLRNGNCDAC